MARPLNGRRALLLTLLILATSAISARGVEPTAGELADAARWTAAKFEAQQKPATPGAGITAVDNHGPVWRNQRGGEPLRIGMSQYEYGVYVHAHSKLIVRLPSPGQRFDANVGIDSRAGGGSVVFHVAVGGVDVFVSPLMKIDTPAALPVSVDLKGQTEFTLEVTDGGDNINSDQSTWAEARVLLADGSTLRLSDLPTLEPKAAPLAVTPPFSVTVDGQPSASLLDRWTLKRAPVSGTDVKHHSLTYTDPQSGLVIRCEGVEYVDAPIVEWTLHFKNAGTQDSPLIADIRAIDTAFDRAPDDLATLRYNTGDHNAADSYEPHADAMPVGYSKRIASVNGRATNESFPYFNLVRGADGGSGGVIVALGWPAQWAASFDRNAAGAVHIAAGQETTHFRLHPGEEVRGPRVVLGFYRGDWMRGQNLWRRWMVKHNMPQLTGKPIPPMQALCTGNFYPGLMTTTKGELNFLKAHIDAGFKFDLWWQDAGWYPCDDKDGWIKVGTWDVDPKRYPKGLREISDYVHAHGMKSLLWFEPERVVAGTWIAEKHPEWVYGGTAGGLLKIGDPACRAWLTDHIDTLMKHEGIDNYRQDFNIEPLAYWQNGEADDRKGMNEIRHVEGYLACWDELLRRKPDMFIDSCASGGRRNDVETMHRAVPLLRSDWYWSPEGQQCQTYGLAMWLPYQGTAVLYSGRSNKDRYWLRSSMVSSMIFAPDSGGLNGADLKLYKIMADEHRQIADCFTADFYPLTPYSLANDVWMAWQYNAAESGTGVVQAFRRPTSTCEVARLALHGLEVDAQYELKDLETGAASKMSGRELMERGLAVTLSTPASATAITYRKVP